MIVPVKTYKTDHVYIQQRLVTTDPLSEVNDTTTRWLDEHGAAEWRTLETKVSEWHVKFHLLLGQLLHLLTETFERRFQFVPQLSFRLE